MALAVDSSSPPVATVTTNTPTAVTTASFTPPANCILYIRWAWNTQAADTPAAPSITDNLGSHLTYNLIDFVSHADSPNRDGQAAHWWAKVTSSAAMTVTVTSGTGTNNQGGALCVAVITGSDLTAPIGAHGKASSASAASIAQSYTAQATNAWGFIGVCDWDLTGAETAGTGCTLTTPAGGSANAGSEVTYTFARRSSADDSNGSANTLNLTLSATSTNLSWVYAEILPPTVAASGTAQPLVVSPIWTPARTTPILLASFPLGNPAQPTPRPLVVGPPFAWTPVPLNYVSASEPLGNPAVGTPGPLVVSTPWTSRVPGALIVASPVPPPVVTIATPGPLVVTPPFAWLPIPPVSLTASQPLGSPAVGTPGPLVVTSPWTSRVPGALIVTSPTPPPVVTGPTPGPLLVSPPFAWVLVPPNTITASQPLGNPAVPTPAPVQVSPPFLWVPVPISRLFTGFAPPASVIQVPVEFVIEPPQRLWQIAMLSPSAGWQPDPPDYVWETSMLSPSTEITFEPPRRLWEISMDVERISSLSLERIRFPVFADSGGAVYNPTADAVSMAFLPSSVDPQPTDFHAGTWDTTVIGTYVAQILVGPSGSVTLAKGTYYAWVKIVDSGGETIVRQVGQLIVD